MTDNIIANKQHDALIKAIFAMEEFISYAKESRYAVPGEADNALDTLKEVYELNYPEVV